MLPIEDSRPFAAVLRDWLGRHSLTTYAAARILPVTRQAIDAWLAGGNCRAEASHRALMTLYDEGRWRTIKR